MVVQSDSLPTLEALGQDFLDRRRQGESISIDHYADSHPDLADQIRHLFPAMAAMERFKSCHESSSGTAVELRLEPFDQIGDFRILREIGRGGMGVVYEADQQSLQRRVAVKVFPKKTLRDSKQLGRFHREARTAAKLHHTNIVPVFGVGQHEGLHYFVMQRIDGQSLEDFMKGGRNTSGRSMSDVGTSTLSSLVNSADESGPESRNARRDPSRWRAIARAGIQVADALEYAHGHGVLHRDIKPSNLLVDPRGRVWVTDFGLATVLKQESEGESPEIAGTLRFMAPEHLAGEQDSRSDLYSLGLTLYELATNRPAFDAPRRSAMVRQIVQGNLVPPREACPAIPRDLEAIILKASDTEPSNRYATAAEMGDDLRRLLEGRTVAARPVGPAVESIRWARRNPAVAALSAALFSLAIVSFGLVSANWRTAVAEGQRAESNLALALESMDQILEKFGSGWMARPMASAAEEESTEQLRIEAQVPVSDYSAGVLRDALKFYDRFAEQNPTNPRLSRDAAKVHHRVADIYKRLGQYASAESAYTRSLQLQQDASLQTEPAAIIERAATINQLGFCKLLEGRIVDAEADFRNAQRILNDPRISSTRECKAERARVFSNLGQCLWRTHRHAEAKRYQQQAVQLLERVVQSGSVSAADRLGLAQAYRNYYHLIHFRATPADREAVRTTAVAILENLVEDYPSVPDFRCELSETLATTRFGPCEQNSRDQRTADLQRSVTISRQLTRTHPFIPRYRSALAVALHGLAEARRDTSPVDADRHYAESVALQRSMTHDYPDIPFYRWMLSRSMEDYAKNLARIDRREMAIGVMKGAIRELEAYLTLRPDTRIGDKILSHQKRRLEEIRDGTLADAERHSPNTCRTFDASKSVYVSKPSNVATGA